MVDTSQTTCVAILLRCQNNDVLTFILDVTKRTPHNRLYKSTQHMPDRGLTTHPHNTLIQINLDNSNNLGYHNLPPLKIHDILVRAHVTLWFNQATQHYQVHFATICHYSRKILTSVLQPKRTSQITIETPRNHLYSLDPLNTYLM